MSGVFISYRREDTAYIAGRLHDELAARFGDQQIFRDVDSMRPGTDFVTMIQDSVASSDALIVMIGDAWLGSADASGRRIDNPEDWVHIEIAAALNRGILIVPVLVEHARMPSEEELPPALAGLSRRNAMELTDVRWDYDVNNLIGVLVDVVKGPPKEQRRDDRP
ncbi:MAG: toll/interleukin-1 receptor domain-containing protein, partial [Actinomycetota bacterium]|nr:toll/interleukin-1 receptor domain-containing protein [Actinomycetota bacterium]